MKRYVLFSLFLLIASGVHAAFNTKEETINRIGTATTVSISTSSWTLCPSASTRANRAGVYVNNPSTSSASMAGILSASSPSEATTIQPLEFQSGEWALIPIGNGINLYLLSLHTSAENAHCQEIGQ